MGSVIHLLRNFLSHSILFRFTSRPGYETPLVARVARQISCDNILGQSRSTSQRSPINESANDSTMAPSTPVEQPYYLVPDLRALDPSAREIDLDAHAWMLPTVIDDEELTFGGKSLSAWYEEDRRQLSEEETRGRSRVSRLASACTCNSTANRRIGEAGLHIVEATPWPSPRTPSSVTPSPPTPPTEQPVLERRQEVLRVARWPLAARNSSVLAAPLYMIASAAVLDICLIRSFRVHPTPLRSVHRRRQT